MIADALKNRTELQESSLVLENSELSRKTARNALLPSLSVYGFYAGTGYAGTAESAEQHGRPTLPAGFGGAVDNAFNYSSPEYQVGFQLNVPLRNRIAKADQYRTELEYRQSQVYLEELKKRIRIEVRNAAFALEQGASRVDAARKARDLAQKTLDITAAGTEAGGRIEPADALSRARSGGGRVGSGVGGDRLRKGAHRSKARRPVQCLRTTAFLWQMQEPALWRQTIPAKQERIRVLVADDQPHILEAVELLLLRKGSKWTACVRRSC